MRGLYHAKLLPEAVPALRGGIGEKPIGHFGQVGQVLAACAFRFSGSLKPRGDKCPLYLAEMPFAAADFSPFKL